MKSSLLATTVENTRATWLAKARAKFATYLVLFKPGVVLLLLWNALVAEFLAARGLPTFHQVIWLVLVGATSAGGAAALNHYFDRDIDAQMPRTRSRPIPSGKIRHAKQVLGIGLANLALAIPVALHLNGTVLLWAGLGAFTYVVVYTLWLKRRTPLNIVIGGAAGSFAVLTGWAAVNPNLSATPILLAALLFLWTPVHFWAFAIVRADDYRAAGVPMLPTVIGAARSARWIFAHSLALALIAALLYFAAPFHWLYALCAIPASALLLRANFALLRQPIAKRAWQSYKVSNLYLMVMFLGMLADVLLF